MSKSTISTFQLFALFPDEETARVYLEGRIWPNGPVCPVCCNHERVSALGACSTRKRGFYRCLACGFDFTVRTNTVMERSKVPLHKWLYSMAGVKESNRLVAKVRKALGYTFPKQDISF